MVCDIYRKQMTHHRMGDIPSGRLKRLLEIYPDKYNGIRTCDHFMVEQYLKTFPEWQFHEIEFLVLKETRKPTHEQRSIRTICEEYRKILGTIRAR